MRETCLILMVLYHPKGILEEYARLLLEEAASCGDCVAVVNGPWGDQACRELERYASRVIVRDNRGFDAGAYKDAMAQLGEEAARYDRLILMNDSFFGFFYPLRTYIQRAEREREVDFWGFTRQPGGAGAGGFSYEAHLQTYFLLVEGRMLKSRDFFEFWRDMDYPESMEDTVRRFETRFTSYFEQRGFRSRAFCDLADLGIEPRSDQLSYYTYAYELTARLGCPALKIKAFAMLEPGAFSAMEYLRANSLYPVGVMEEFLERGIFRAGGRFHMPFDGRRLEAFCRRYRRVFLYGAGRWAEKIRWYLERRGICIGGNVVTEPERERGRAVIGYRELRLKEDEGLIAALSERHTRECMETIRSLGREEQIFWGDFGRPAGGKES